MSTKNIKKIPNTIHPGEILLEEFLVPLQMSQYRLAKDIQVPPRRINEIVHGTRGVTADTALRLAQYFGTTSQFWLNLQNQYDLTVSRQLFNPAVEKLIQPLATQP
jgi:addiction module HigA family antidote